MHNARWASIYRADRLAILHHVTRNAVPLHHVTCSPCPPDIQGLEDSAATAGPRWGGTGVARWRAAPSNRERQMRLGARCPGPQASACLEWRMDSVPVSVSFCLSVPVSVSVYVCLCLSQSRRRRPTVTRSFQAFVARPAREGIQQHPKLAPHQRAPSIAGSPSTPLNPKAQNPPTLTCEKSSNRPGQTSAPGCVLVPQFRLFRPDWHPSVGAMAALRIAGLRQAASLISMLG